MPYWITSIAPTVTAVGSLSAVAASLYVSMQTRKEVHTDRKLKILPLITFEPGPMAVPICQRRFGHRIGGLNPEYVESAFSHVSPDAQVVEFTDPTTWVANLTNHGQGPAFEVRVTWVAHKINLEHESFTIDREKNREPKYSAECNTMPALPSHLGAGKSAQLSRIPVFLTLDTGRQIRSVNGEVKISYLDSSGEEWSTLQKVRIAPAYDPDDQILLYTFGDVCKLPWVK